MPYLGPQDEGKGRFLIKAAITSDLPYLPNSDHT